MNTAVSVPEHVPAELVADVDIYDMPGSENDPHLAWKALDRPDSPGLVWTPRNGGHWIATTGKIILEWLSDGDRFSAREIAVPPGLSEIPFIPNQSDEPEHQYYRRIVLPFLKPEEVHKLSEHVRALAIDLIEGFRARGHCEFVAEFSRHLPMRIFLSLVDLPEEDREWLIDRAEQGVRGPTPEARQKAQHEMGNYLQSWIDKRQENPGDDLLSAIIQGRVGDRPMSPEEVIGEAMDVMFGGLDTVASMMGFIMRYLATHPEHYNKLVEDPGRIPIATEELFRRHGVATIARRALVDVEHQDVTIRAGEMVILPTCLHGLDERIWDDPFNVNFDRPLERHGTFGKGVHTCPGAGLARSEIAIMLEEWTKRIPEFSLAPDVQVRTATGSTNGVLELQLVWPAESNK